MRFPELPLVEPGWVPKRTRSSIGEEFFCFEGGRRRWTPGDETTRSARHRGINPTARPARGRKVERWVSFRVTKGYPMLRRDTRGVQTTALACGIRT